MTAVRRELQQLAIHRRKEPQMAVRRLNHAVLYVHGLERTVDFYPRRSASRSGWRSPAAPRSCAPRARPTTTTSACSRSAPGRAPDRPEHPGLYHLAWEVGTLADLAEARAKLAAGRRAGGGERPPRVQVAVRQGPERHRVRGHVAGARRGLGRRDGRRRHDPPARPGCRDRALGPGPGDRRRGRLAEPDPNRPSDTRVM